MFIGRRIIARKVICLKNSLRNRLRNLAVHLRDKQRFELQFDYTFTHITYSSHHHYIKGKARAEYSSQVQSPFSAREFHIQTACV